MLAVGIKVLKNKLSEYVRRAAEGEVVLITDRDKVVAELVPPAAGRPVALHDARLAELVKSGPLRPPLVGPDTPPQTFSMALPLATVLRELDEDRSERS